MHLRNNWRDIRLFEHEFGHILGADDFYLDNTLPTAIPGIPRDTVPTDSNWVGNLMTDQGPTLNWRNAEDILRFYGKTLPVPFNIGPSGRQPWPTYPQVPQGWNQSNSTLGSFR